MSEKERYFTVRDKVLCDVVYDIEKSGARVFSLRCGGAVKIRGAGKFLKIDEAGKFTWRDREVIEHFTKLSHLSLYLLTEKEVWKITTVDKRNPLWIDKMCDSWLQPHEIEEQEKIEKKDS